MRTYRQGHERVQSMRLPSCETLEVATDEVGRGCLLGPVVAAAVILPPVEEMPDEQWREIRDSKKLSAKKRERLAAYIQRVARAWAVGEATVEEIDRYNILQATMRAMHRACDAVYRHVAFEHILVDGPYFHGYQPPGRDARAVSHECVAGGDDQVLAIAAASILAKDHRDRAMAQLVEDHPELGVYGIGKNMGYGTAVHMRALQEHGATPFHRRSFGPVARVGRRRQGEETQCLEDDGSE